MPERLITIEIASQSLIVADDGVERMRFPISTARNGAGEESGSGCTPRGRHAIRIKIGDGCPENAVFVGRRFTGEIYHHELALQFPQRDWILSRVLWLTGLEPGRNRFGTVDSLRRFIYIHGTPDSEPMGTPRSHGCIRMRNRDIIALFPVVHPGDLVQINE